MGLSPTDWIYIIVLVVVIIGLLIWIMNELRFKHKVIIRQVANDRRIIRIDRAKDYKDSEGVPYWKLKKERNKIKKLIPLPPQESIEITTKGRKLIEVYCNEDGEYIFIKDTNTNINSFQPLTRNDRLTLIHSYKTAEFKNKKSLAEQIQQWVLTGSIIIMVSMVLIFAPDLVTSYTKGATQISDSMQEYEEVRHNNLIEEQKQWDKITQGIQTIYNIEKDNQERISELENG